MERFVLFSGGLDSAYRLCQLAREKDAVVQPVYVMFPNIAGNDKVRPELAREMKAQDDVVSFLLGHKDTKAMILPVKRIDMQGVYSVTRYLPYLDYLYSCGLGWQYLYFAALADFFPSLELCQEYFPSVALADRLKLKETAEGYVVDRDASALELSLLFGGLFWPIFGVTRSRMVDDLKAWGCHDVLKLVWWCYRNMDGKPCGVCDNCRAKIQQGLGYLFSKEAIHRYLVYTFLESHYSVDTCGFYLYDYLYRHDDVVLNEQDNMVLKNKFRLFDRITALSDKELMKTVVSGSLKYGCHPNKMNKVLGYRRDDNRVHMFDYLKNKS